jgi:hypothetical protein
MTVSKLITLKEIFPLHHEKIVERLGSNSDLQSIVEDLLECHQLLTNASAEHIDGQVPREFWEELFEDLRNEAIELVARETS